MANAENQFQQGYTFEQFMDIHGEKLQKKVDKPGGAVTGAGNNLRVGANRGNLVDDAMIALADGTFGNNTPTEGLYDNRSTPIFIPTVGSPHTGFIDIVTPFDCGQIEWMVFIQGVFEESPLNLSVDFARDAAYLELLKFQSYEYQGILNINPAITLLYNGQTLTEPVPGTRRLYWRVQSADRVANANFALTIRTFNRGSTTVSAP